MPVNQKRITRTLAALVLMAISTGLGGCAPEVGSERWCEDMAEKTEGRLDRQRSAGLR